MTAKEMAERMRDYEAGHMEADEVIRLFQDLVDMGLAWHVGERYRRTTEVLLREGTVVSARGETTEREYVPREPVGRLAAVGR